MSWRRFVVAQHVKTSPLLPCFDRILIVLSVDSSYNYGSNQPSTSIEAVCAALSTCTTSGANLHLSNNLSNNQNNSNTNELVKNGSHNNNNNSNSNNNKKREGNNDDDDALPVSGALLDHTARRANVQYDTM
jgi:hypothetical protein